MIVCRNGRSLCPSWPTLRKRCAVCSNKDRSGRRFRKGGIVDCACPLSGLLVAGGATNVKESRIRPRAETGRNTSWNVRSAKSVGRLCLARMMATRIGLLWPRQMGGCHRQAVTVRSAFHPRSRRSAPREVFSTPSGESSLKECNVNGDFSPPLHPSRFGRSA